MRNQAVQILWDCSHIWGLMAWRAMTALGLPCELVSGKEIAQGSLLRNPPAILLVPGGNAAQKAQRLGRDGLDAIRCWAHDGGFYLGFCGGSGLALTHGSKDECLALCPWGRQAFSDRFYHMLSGHVLARTPRGVLAIPVWWPGRFEPEPADGIEILARYIRPGKDLWLADLPIMDIPPGVRAKWRQNGYLADDLHFPAGQPLTISGKYGKGQYILSYAHLETPASPAANAWLASLLGKYASLRPISRAIPPWNTATCKNLAPGKGIRRDLRVIHHKLRQLVRVAARTGHLFTRSTWLWGWRPGMPGMVCNNLLASASALAGMDYSEDFPLFYSGHREKILGNASLFCKLAEDFFWSENLKNALDSTHPGCLARDNHFQEKNSIFGHPMQGGGIAQNLLQDFEDLIYMAHRPT